MIINVVYDTSVNNAPAAFKTAVNSVVQFFQSHFTNSITINIDVGYGEIGPNNSALSQGALGESQTFFNKYTYSTVKNALPQNATLPASDPTGNGNWWVSTAESKALGLSGPSSAVDGYVGFATGPWDYDNTNGVNSGTYDFMAVVAHEFSEVMGRVLFVGTDGIGSNAYTPFDLFHYSGVNQRDFVGTTAGYFSVDGGKTNLDSFNTSPSGDFGDWAASAGHDSFLAFSPSGVVNAVSQSDLTAMNALGYSSGPPPNAISPPTFLAAGDFAHDGTSDALWQNADGSIVDWQLSGFNLVSSTTVGSMPSNWHFGLLADVNGDGKSDILWQSNTGGVVVWEMNGPNVAVNQLLGQIPTNWHLAASGDFNGDGKSDLLLHSDAGGVVVWTMNGAQVVGDTLVGQIPANWHVGVTGDFNGDGKSDVLLHSDAGGVVLWTMNGAQVVGNQLIGQVPSNWHMAGSGDFNGDGKTDVLWLSDSGQVDVWLMNGTQVTADQYLGQGPAGYQFDGVGDFDGNHTADIMWGASNGTVLIWEMNGTQIAASQTVTTGAASTAQAVAPMATELSEVEGYFGAGTVPTGIGGNADVVAAAAGVGGAPGDGSPTVPSVTGTGVGGLPGTLSGALSDHPDLMHPFGLG